MYFFFLTRTTCFTACITQAVRERRRTRCTAPALHITTRFTRFTCLPAPARCAGRAGGGDERATLVRAAYYYTHYSLYCVHYSGCAGGGDERAALVRAALRLLLREQRRRSRTPRQSRWCMCGVCGVCVVGVQQSSSGCAAGLFRNSAGRCSRFLYVVYVVCV